MCNTTNVRLRYLKQDFTLTREMVDNAARRLTPACIVRYFVNLADKEIPIKQLFAAALRIERQDFWTDEAELGLSRLCYRIERKY